MRFPTSLSDGIVGYMRKQAGPSARELQTVEDVKKFLASTEHSVIGGCLSLAFSLSHTHTHTHTTHTTHMHMHMYTHMPTHTHACTHMHAHTHTHTHTHTLARTHTHTHTHMHTTQWPHNCFYVLIVLGFFTEEESKLRKAFTSVADTMRDSFRFAFSTAKEVLEEYSYSE